MHSFCAYIFVFVLLLCPLSMFNFNQCYYNIYQPKTKRNKQRHRRKLKLWADTAEKNTHEIKHARNAHVNKQTKILSFVGFFIVRAVSICVHVFVAYFGVFNLNEFGFFFFCFPLQWIFEKERKKPGHKQKAAIQYNLQL